MPDRAVGEARTRDPQLGKLMLYGRVGVIQFHPSIEELLHAFDTRPPVRKEV